MFDRKLFASHLSANEMGIVLRMLSDYDRAYDVVGVITNILSKKSKEPVATVVDTPTTVMDLKPHTMNQVLNALGWSYYGMRLDQKGYIKSGIFKKGEYQIAMSAKDMQKYHRSGDPHTWAFKRAFLAYMAECEQMTVFEYVNSLIGNS